jgi:hypothetical protein
VDRRYIEIHAHDDEQHAEDPLQAAETSFTNEREIEY